MLRERQFRAQRLGTERQGLSLFGLGSEAPDTTDASIDALARSLACHPIRCSKVQEP